MIDREQLMTWLHDFYGCDSLYFYEEANALIDKLIANGVMVQRMTPITEGFPSEECLAVNDCGKYMVGKIVKDPYCTVTGYACMSDFGGTEVGIGDITYWQPLPEPRATVLEDVLTFDVEPVKHGEWEHDTCSICGAEWFDWTNMKPFATNYCPSCGARMDGGKES